jgi:hypothetical protein
VNELEPVVAYEPVFPFTLAVNVLTELLNVFSEDVVVLILAVNVLIELLNAIKLAVNELIEPVDATLAVKLFNEAVVELTDEVKLLNELVFTTLAVKLFNEAVVELTELLNVFELVANVLNEEVNNKLLVFTFTTDEVVANPKLVICVEELIVPANEDVYVSNADLDKNIDTFVTKLLVSASVINEPV